MNARKKNNKKSEPQYIEPAHKAWPEPFANRLKRLRAKMAEHDVDAMLLTHDKDLRYMTGFTGEDSWMLVTQDKTLVISDGRFLLQLPSMCPFVRVFIRKDPILKSMQAALEPFSIDRLALQARHMTLQVRNGLLKQVKSLKVSQLYEADGWMETLRMIKDEHELKLIRKAIRIQETAYERMLKQIEPGMTEQHCGALLNYEMRLAGAEGIAFNTIVAADANGALPHAMPSSRKLKSGSVVTFDFGAVYQGYCGDITRTIAMRRMTKKLREIYSIVLEAQQSSIDAIRHGARFADVDMVGRKVIERAGYGDYFTHSTGHGMGLDVHEKPIVHYRASGALEAGQVVTVEPGIYLEGWGGVRIEDDVLVTEKGHKVLTSLPKDIDSATI